MRLLIVEDDSTLSSILREAFSEHRIETVLAADFTQGRDRAVLGTFDVMILDIMLPGGSGLDLCAHIRSRGISTPILMLTARDSVGDRIRGLEQGADDYLPKPFALGELVARVKALARRRPAIAQTFHRIADLEVDLAIPRVRRGGEDITLTAKELALLACLVNEAGHVVTRATIAAQVWDENHNPFTNVLEVLVRRLRRKIDRGHDRKLIHTFRGLGYRLSEESE